MKLRSLPSCGAAQFLTGRSSPGGWGPPALSERMVNISAIDAKIESGNTEKMGLRD